MKNIRIAIIGVGNCASSLIQGIHYYRKSKKEDACGLMHWLIGGYKPGDIDIVAAWDIDKRKVGKDLSEAIFAKPNCTKIFHPHIKSIGVNVRMGHIGDSLSVHMEKYPENRRFIVAKCPEATKRDIISVLKKSRTDVLLNYLPVGSEQTARFYMECALEAGVAVINNMPVFIASDKNWTKRFQDKNIPIIGDDVKSQIGATIIHRALTNLFRQRGVGLDHTYQLNFGGNTDFLNMKNAERLSSKKKSKTEAIQSVASKKLASEDIHISPTDYVPWQNDNKVAYIRMEGRVFANVPMNLELRLSVEDSPNSAGVVIDAIRCCKLALDRHIGGVLSSPSAFFMKHPPRQYPDEEAFRITESFISGHRSR